MVKRKRAGDDARERKQSQEQLAAALRGISKPKDNGETGDNVGQ